MKTVLITLGIPPTIGILGALLAEYVFGIGVLGTAKFVYFLTAGVAAALLVFTLFRKKSFAGATLIGFLAIPYAAFLVGQIDIYMVDDNLIQGMTVSEVRPTMERIVFGTPAGGEVAVWNGPQTVRLYPGKNRVKLGRFAMPANTYQGGSVVIGDIEVDIGADLSAMKNPADGEPIPPDYYDEVFEMIRSQISGEVAGFPVSMISSALSGNVGTFTIAVGNMTLPLPIPTFTYPGFGGPDITVDITLDEMGRPDPSKLNIVVEMPPGVSGAFPSIPGMEFR